MIIAVSDTGPLIHLSEIDPLCLLAVVDELLVPETVYEELQEGGLPDALAEMEYERVEVNEDGLETVDELDAGEAAAVAIAADENAVLLTDDLTARRTAKNEDIEVHGSIGVIALAFGRGMLDCRDAAARMRALQQETSLFVTDAVVERGIDLLESDK